jgi:hypothetical protein
MRTRALRAVNLIPSEFVGYLLYLSELLGI